MFEIRTEERGRQTLIATERIIAEMERQLRNAKMANDEQAIREALTAISSLCEVVLGSEMTTESSVATPTTMIAQQPLVPAVSSLESKPLVEKDANGGSIFDF